MSEYPDATLCPANVTDSLLRYVDSGVRPGGFLCAVLANDLTAAIGFADLESLDALPHIVAFAINKLPSRSWGSREAISKWVHEHQGAAR